MVGVGFGCGGSNKAPKAQSGGSVDSWTTTLLTKYGILFYCQELQSTAPNL